MQIFHVILKFSVFPATLIQYWINPVETLVAQEMFTNLQWNVLMHTYSSWVLTSWGNIYICLKLSIASTGRSLLDLPRWYSGCENFKPSANKKLTPPAKENLKHFNKQFSFFNNATETCVNLKVLNNLSSYFKELHLRILNPLLFRHYTKRPTWVHSLFSPTSSLETRFLYCSGVSVSSGWWNIMTNGKPSSVNSCLRNK